jgi:alcohol dehydrogenase
MHQHSFFRAPKTIIYGRGSFEKIGSEAVLKGKKALIVSDKTMDTLGYVSECRDGLKKEGVESVVYNGVNSEPTDEYVSAALGIHQQEGCDFIISIGGGSCIDAAKAVSVVASNGGQIGEYMGGIKRASVNPVPHIAIPTTAGTGSEATDVTVIINVANDEKMMIKQPAFMPEVAIVDSALTQSSPKGVTAATGIDALTHAIEAFLSKKAHPLTDTLALSAMKLIFHNIRKAYEDGTDEEARDAMSLAALQAGMAFTNASVALVHGMSRPVGALFHVPHGISNAMLLPAVLEYSRESCAKRLAEVAKVFSGKIEFRNSEDAASFAVQEVKKICVDLNIPSLKNYGIDQEKFERAVEKMSLDALKSGSPANNPKVPSQEEIKKLYRVCYDYSFTEAQSAT